MNKPTLSADHVAQTRSLLLSTFLLPQMPFLPRTRTHLGMGTFEPIQQKQIEEMVKGAT
jgi:hypothetical protein